MSSSGVLAADRLVWRTCEACGIDNEVVELIDPEGPHAEWVCPECDHPNDTTEPVFYDGPDPDYARDVARDDLWN